MSNDGLTPAERHVLDTVARAGVDGILLSALKATGGDSAVISEAVRNLFQTRKVTVVRAPSGGDHILTLSKPPVSENFNIVMGVVRSSGASGIDVAGIMSRTKIPKAEITKAIGQFIQQQAIKETRCFTNKARKLYIAAEFEPSTEVTGGTFYTEARDLDVDLIDQMRQKIVSYIANSGLTTVQRLKVTLDQDPRIAQRRVTLREVATIARTLELDGILKRTNKTPHESVVDGWGERGYVLASAQLPELLAPGLGGTDVWAATFPCVSCPQLAVCHPRGVINPGTCAYLADWLDVSGSSRGPAKDATMEPPARPQPRPSTRGF